MSAVIDILAEHPVAIGRELRKKREGSRLTLAQAAAALGVSPITLDGWEQGRKPQISADAADREYSAFRKRTNGCFKTGNNLIFGAFPVRIAKDILGITVDRMAEKCGYSLSSWTKMEANSRLVPKEKMAEIEEWVSDAWSAACG